MATGRSTPHSTSLGCDGIAWHDGAIIAVQNGVDQNIALAGEPTIGAVVGDRFVHVANSQWDEHDDDGRRLPNTTLSAPRLLSVPLGKSLP